MVPYVLRLAVALLLPTLATGDAAEGVPAGGAKSPSAWTGAEVGEWLFEQGLGPYRDAFAAHGIDGHHLLALRDHAMKETFNMEGSDRATLREATAGLRSGILDAPADIWDWRAANRHHHDALLTGIVNCPRVTILYLYHFEYKESLRPLFYRDGTGLGFWTSWLLCPRLEIAHYLEEFRPHHPQLVDHMWATAIGSTVTEGCSWLLLFCASSRLPANERGIDGDIVKMVFSKALMTVGLWLVHPLLSHKYQDMCVCVMLAWPYIGILMGLFYVKEAIKWIASGCSSGSGSLKQDGSKGD